MQSRRAGAERPYAGEWRERDGTGCYAARMADPAKELIRLAMGRFGNLWPAEAKMLRAAAEGTVGNVAHQEASGTFFEAVEPRSGRAWVPGSWRSRLCEASPNHRIVVRTSRMVDARMTAFRASPTRNLVHAQYAAGPLECHNNAEYVRKQVNSIDANINAGALQRRLAKEARSARPVAPSTTPTSLATMGTQPCGRIA